MMKTNPWEKVRWMITPMVMPMRRSMRSWLHNPGTMIVSRNTARKRIPNRLICVRTMPAHSEYPFDLRHLHTRADQDLSEDLVLIHLDLLNTADLESPGEDTLKTGGDH